MNADFYFGGKNVLSSLMNDPAGYIMELALRLPAVLLAICLHESAHGWVAEKCGDPTARLYGRITLNPVRHFDLVGMLFMFFVGVGWAKPVPVNPMNFRNYRKDDLKVSLAGITANLLLALVSLIGCYCLFTAAFIPFEQTYYLRSGSEIWFKNALWNSQVIKEMWGAVPAYLYEMLVYMVTVNLSLAIFNLIPVPPLDGYHVLNDLILKRPLFTSQRTAAAGHGILMLLMISGILSKVLNTVFAWVISGAGNLAYTIVSALGVA